MTDTALTPAGPATRLPAGGTGPAESGAGRPPQDPAAILCALIADVLGTPAVDPGQSFTGLGGDSIQAIQVVSRARPAGLLLSTRDVLRSETVAALAAGARAVGGPGAGARTAAPARRTGPLAPTPIMAWLGELGGPVDTYHQTLVVRSPAGCGRAEAVRIVRALLDTHDVLRMRVPGGAAAAGDAPYLPPPGTVDADLLVEHHDVRAAADADLPGLTTDRIRAARRLLSPADGVMLRAILLDRGPDRQGRLALVVHHLAVDGVSWRILQDDLRSCWAQLAAGADPAPEPAPTPFAHWAGLLRADAVSGRRTAEADRWAGMLRPAPEPLGGVCAPDRLDAESAAHRLTLTLPPDVTGPLLTTAPGLVNGTVNDVLLTGLALAVLGWRRPVTGDADGGTVLVDVEGHGREEITDGLDLSRTVGWFTTVYPVRFALGRPDLDDARAGGPTAGAVLRQVKEALRAVPDHGIGHGLLRHTNPRTAPRLAALGIPELGFNYLGRFPMGDTADWAAAPGHDVALDDADEGLPMAHAVEVNAAAHEGPGGPVLSATWTWAGNAHPAGRVRALAEEWFVMLRALARHTATAGTAAPTPSDVTLSGLSQADLDAFESQLRGVL
ncbi:condensation domain-containing protein [Streptomyces tropicalis]|uniref:Condensation domain-containing protein n=1 Tax=Streptomyces tropicalis TaxID=3034234 RepID=A0ABT6A4E7_9ACTN|nr:condensation domain-containing protein [Streptomyces tropicalis]MDF3299500.1 condensation domain-containing protein [Streptomyces tropicalis]